jgi:hypothetical protein
MRTGRIKHLEDFEALASDVVDQHAAVWHVGVVLHLQQGANGGKALQAGQGRAGQGRPAGKAGIPCKVKTANCCADPAATT